MVMPISVLLSLVGLLIQQSTQECNLDELPCLNGDCIKSQNWCDKEFDCVDRSDENFCLHDPCEENYFQCRKGRCIPKSAVCNDYENCDDGSDEINCTGGNISAPSTKSFKRKQQLKANQAVTKAVEYLLRMRESDYGWGSFTPRAVVAMSFAEKVFQIPDHEKTLMKQRLNVQILMNLMKNEELNLVLLAHYINALYALCEDPRSFHGMDLVDILRSETDKRNSNDFNLPFVLMTLCIAKQTRPTDTKLLLSMYDDQSNDRLSFKALTIIAMSICSRHSYRREHMKNIQDRKRDFLNSAEKRKSALDIYTRALVDQAFYALGAKPSSPIWTNQLADGSFGDLLATYYAIPALLNTSLLHLKCKGPKYEETTLASSHSLSNYKDSREKTITYSLRISQDPDDVAHTMSITFEGNKTLYNVMKMAASRDPMYRFMCDEIDSRKKVYCLGSFPSDPETGMSWTLYHGHGGSFAMDDLTVWTEETRGIDEIFPEDGSHFLYFRKYNVG